MGIVSSSNDQVRFKFQKIPAFVKDDTLISLAHFLLFRKRLKML